MSLYPMMSYFCFYNNNNIQTAVLVHPLLLMDIYPDVLQQIQSVLLCTTTVTVDTSQEVETVQGDVCLEGTGQEVNQFVREVCG